MRNTPFFILMILASSCYHTLSIDGFDKEKWINSKDNCSTYRLDIINLIIKNQEVLLKRNQNDVESLLGRAKEHELYDRNQKFFHYRLTPPTVCKDYDEVKYLSIRFNAIGRANLIQVMLRESQ